MKWDGDFEFTVDDRALLRAILLTEGNDEGFSLYHQGMPNPGATAIRRHIIDKPGFKIVLENEHLRTLLRAFLESNIRVADQQGMLAIERERGVVTRWFRRPVIENLKAGLKDLEVTRDEAFKKYEMLRRLTDWENTLLKRLPA